MISKQDKNDIINLFKDIDVKKLEIDHADDRIVKYFRFGSYTGLQIASEIIKQLPEKKRATKNKAVVS